MTTISPILQGNTPIRTINLQIFTASGTYTPTSGMVYCIIEVVGGGGSGAGQRANTGTNNSVGGGGGGGGYAKAFYTAAQIGASQSVTIGSGGTGPSDAAGQAGVTTSVGSLLSATGGNGGNIGNGPSSAYVCCSLQVNPGLGTVSSGTAMGAIRGDFNGAAIYTSQTYTPPSMNGGAGGGGWYGYGGGWGSGTAATANSGGGGGGIVKTGPSSAGTGANGAAGVVLIWEYISTNTIGYSPHNIADLGPSTGILSSFNVQKLTASSGTYVPTSGMKYCIVDVQGPGGAGGDSVAATGGSLVCAGGGGGGGGIVRALWGSADIGSGITYTIDSTKAQFNTSSVMVANAGTAGTSAATAYNTLSVSAGGIGGSATLGGSSGFSSNGFALRGHHGEPGCAHIDVLAYASGGNGANGYLGMDGTVGSSGDSNGVNGTANSGCGGSGAASLTGGPYTGGTAGSGVIYVYEYIAS